MFCANCGKDCGKQLFCSRCGQQLYKDITIEVYHQKRKELHKAGKIYCPMCLSTNCVPDDQLPKRSYRRYPLAAAISIVTKIAFAFFQRRYGKAYTCRECGKTWYSKRESACDGYREQVMFLIGKYSRVIYSGCNNVAVHLEEDRLVIHRPGRRKYVIRHWDLCGVYYDGCVDLLKGRLTLRDRAHKRKKRPSTIAAAEKDRLTIFFDQNYKYGFYQLYSALWAIVEENKKAGII